MPKKTNDPEHEGRSPSPFRVRPKVEQTRFNARDILLNAAGIAAVTRVVVERGDALSFSLTSDGGQLCITRLHNREPFKCYVPKDCSMTDALIALADEYGADYVQILRVALVAAESEQPALPFE